MSIVNSGSVNELVLTMKQIEQVQNYAIQIIENLPAKAVNELLEGYNYDQEALMNEIFRQTTNVVNFNATLESEKLSYLTSLEYSMDASLKKLSYNYFKTTCLPNFTQGWRNLEWGNLIQLFPWSLFLASRGHGKSYEVAYAFPLWRLYGYDRPIPFQKDSIDNRNRKETMIITNESTLGKTHLSKITEEIRNNEILAEKLNPNGTAELGKEGVVTETGSLVKLRSLNSSGIRGNHCGAVVYDDLLDESSLYSKEQRAKAKEIFTGSITPVVEPFGFFLGGGTPYVDAKGDIYTDLKSDPKHMVWEYPSITPYYVDGVLKYRLLAPDRFSYKDLLAIKASLGSAVFSREYLVTPVTDNSSIFPYEYINKCTYGMENVSFVHNIESFPFKLQRVVIGVDWAKSGNVSADYTVMVVMGVDVDENYYIVNIWRKRGAHYNEQIGQLVAFNQRYRPNKIVVESNGFQGIMADLAESRGLRNIESFTTTAFNKKNSYEGLPSIAAIMERGQLRVPYRQGETANLVDLWANEFNSVAYNEDSGKLEGVGSHDDMCMATFFAIQELRSKNVKFKFSMA